MPKFIMSIGDKTLQLLAEEAKLRNVRVQELLRAVIVPEWVRTNLDTSVKGIARGEVDTKDTIQSMFNALQRKPVLEASISRGRHQRASASRSRTLSVD